ncbi:MAG: hypothetical protein JWO08_2781 [Verrucomicrobiaceae bacterium]|nr:hypothetical protein [Verrucomicrobiaceae bacterium]
MVFAFGIVMMMLGSFVTFAPGGARVWFNWNPVLLLPGLVISSWPVRLTALCLIAVCIFAM